MTTAIHAGDRLAADTFALHGRRDCRRPWRSAGYSRKCGGAAAFPASSVADRIERATAQMGSSLSPTEARLALNRFDHLAAKDNPAAQYGSPHMSELGVGVPKDITKAISLYAKAAAQNSIPAEARLGEIYLNGDLAPPDYAKAFDLLGKAARQGNPRAAMRLGQITDSDSERRRSDRELRLVGSGGHRRAWLRKGRARGRLRVDVVERPRQGCGARQRPSGGDPEEADPCQVEWILAVARKNAAPGGRVAARNDG